MPATQLNLSRTSTEHSRHCSNWKNPKDFYLGFMPLPCTVSVLCCSCYTQSWFGHLEKIEILLFSKLMCVFLQEPKSKAFSPPAAAIKQDSGYNEQLHVMLSNFIHKRRDATDKNRQIPFPGVINWVQIWQFRQLWHLFDMVFMFIKLDSDHARPVDDSTVILPEST